MAVFVLSGCPGDDGAASDDETTSSGSTGSTTTDDSDSTTSSDSSDGVTSIGPTSVADADTTAEDTTAGDTTSGDTTTGDTTTGDTTTGDTTTGDTTAGPCEEQRFYLDADMDDYGDPDDFIDACEPVGSYDVLNDQDCCDFDEDVNPAHTDFEAVANACGDYDYNCDNVEEPMIEACGVEPGACESYWTSCPAPACGQDGDLLLQTPAGGGLCSVANIVGTQSCI